MKPIFEWFLSFCAGILLSTQSSRILKMANDEDDFHIVNSMDSSAVHKERPYILGSEQISSALQQILSSDENVFESPSLFIGAQHNLKSDCVLGSESLNRMLEDMLALPGTDNSKLPHIEPAMQL